MAKEILDFPVAGKRYRVKAGDRFSFLAGAVYGNPAKKELIVQANPFVIGRPISLEDLPTIYAGNILQIPYDAPIERFKRTTKLKLLNKKRDDFTLLIEGRELIVESGRVVRTMDTLSDAWTATIAWTPFADPELDRITAPSSYSEASVYLGSDLMVNGQFFTPTRRLGARQEQTLEGFSFTINAVDSTIRPPYEKNNIDLKQRALDMMTPLEVNVSVDSGVSIGGPFDRVSPEPTDLIGNHLTKLASQRGLLLTSDQLGDLLITEAKTGGSSVDTIEEGFPGASEYVVRFDGRKRFQTYRAIGQTAKKRRRSKTESKASPIGNNKSGIVKDDVISVPRFLTFRADEASSANIEDAAIWKRNKAIVDSLTLPFPVPSWYNSKGKLWRENTLVTVVSPTIGTGFEGATLLIRQVEYIYDKGGTTAVLSLIPPEAYTKQIVQEPWVAQ